MSRPLCIITGAGRGIGRATAMELALRGFDCVLVSRSREQLEETARRIKTDSLVSVADVTDAHAVAQVVDDALKRFGRIDAIVNNAGLAPMKSMDVMDNATWQSVLDTNLSSPFYLAKAAWDALKASKGAIVNIGSEASRDPFPGFIAYATAKAGVNMLTQMLHREGRAFGIRAYCVAPAAVETDMFRALISEDQVGKDKTLDPADVARTIAACIAGDLRFSSGETVFVHRS